MPGKQKITPRARREMILRALRGESQAALGREYGLSRQRVNEYMTKATLEAEERYEDARSELEFRREVYEMTE